MIVMCTKCGTLNDVPRQMAAPFDICKKCGDRFADQHMHIELSPPPYPEPSSLYPRVLPMSDADNYELGRADERLSIRAMVDAIYKFMDDPSSCSDEMRGYLREQLAIYRVATQRVYDAAKKRGWYP